MVRHATLPSMHANSIRHAENDVLSRSVKHVAQDRQVHMVPIEQHCAARTGRRVGAWVSGCCTHMQRHMLAMHDRCAQEN